MHAVPFSICAMALALPAQANEQCVQRPSVHYGPGLAQLLSSERVPHRITPKGICVDEKHAAALDAAERNVDNHFWEVAHLIRSTCEERALIAWATKENLRFEVNEVVDLARKPAGRMFHLRSYTKDEVQANHRRLAEAMRLIACRLPGPVA